MIFNNDRFTIYNLFHQSGKCNLSKSMGEIACEHFMHNFIIFPAGMSTCKGISLFSDCIVIKPKKVISIYCQKKWVWGNLRPHLCWTMTSKSRVQFPIFRVIFQQVTKLLKFLHIKCLPLVTFAKEGTCEKSER